jgi:uncharacterized protein (DUF362 family)
VREVLSKNTNALYFDLLLYDSLFLRCGAIDFSPDLDWVITLSPLESMLNLSSVALTQGESAYPSKATNPAFHPSERYPEYPFEEFSIVRNDAYHQVRQLLRQLRLDDEKYGTPEWNPLGELVKPGNSVVLKPNFVRHHHRLGKSLDCVITHGSVLRAIMDYVWIALEGKGEIVVADSPQGDTDFSRLIESNGVKALFDYYSRHKTNTLFIGLRDLRKEWTVYKHGGVIWERIKLDGDPHGYTTINLGKDSAYLTLHNKNYYGADYDRGRTRQFHNEDANMYNIANTILKSDVFICVPKLKVHRKVGVTLNIKNLIGVNGEKNFLPHFVIGSPAQGGDEFSNDTFNNKIDRKLKDLLLWKYHFWGKYLYVVWHGIDKYVLRRFQARQSYVKGDWWGNDTTWRAAVDLNKILLYCDKGGQMQTTLQRRYLSIIDGIVGGEGEGPLTPDPIYSGILIGGFDPLTVDIFASTMMGIDWRKLKMLVGASQVAQYSLSTVPAGFYNVASLVEHDYSKPMFKFRPPAGWMGHVELDG